MRIVRATRAHSGALARLMVASPLLRRYGVTRHRASAALREATRERDLILVATERTTVIGLAWVIATRALDRSAYLRLLLVAQRSQSRGVGAALLADAERRARGRGCRHMVLLVTTTNRRARAFYASHGYRHLGDLPSFVRAGVGESLYLKSWTKGHSA